jgi:hypothetical protein
MFIITCQFSLLIFLFFFSLTKCLHFLSGSFTYKHIQQIIDYRISKSILVEIRFHSLNQFCLLEENILYDNKTIARKRDEQYYDIKCFSEKYNNACRNFTQQISAFCQRINEKSGYAIFKRQFVFIVERLKPLNLYYVRKLDDFCVINKTC